jgi:hypothetical protein
MELLAMTSDVPASTATIAGLILARIPGFAISRLEAFAGSVDKLGARLAAGRAVEGIGAIEEAYLDACVAVRTAAASVAAVNHDAIEQAGARTRDMEERLRTTMQALSGSRAARKLVEHLFNAPGNTLTIDDLIQANSGSRVKLDSQKRNTMRHLCNRTQRHLEDISAPLRIVRIANAVQLTTSD